MPDPLSMFQGLAASIVVAAAILLLASLPWRSSIPWRLNAGWALAIGAGLMAGCRVLAIGPQVPPVGARDRLLLLVLPAAMIAQIVSGIPRVPEAIGWVLKYLVAALAARVLLHGSVYLSIDPSNTDSGWPGGLSVWAGLGILAVLAAFGWWHMDRLAQVAQSRVVLVGMALTALTSALIVMMSGTLTSGQLGIALAGSLIGSAAASLVIPAPRALLGSTGVATLFLFGILVIGRFFADLTTMHALVLFMAPAIMWLGEIPRIRKLPLWVQVVIRLTMLSIVLAIPLASAQQHFAEQSGSEPSGSPGISLDDYESFGK